MLAFLLHLALQQAAAHPAQSPQAQAQAEPLALVGAAVLEPGGTGWLRGHAVVVADGRIVSVTAREELPAGGARLDLDGLYLVPGLIDLHTHLLLHPYDETPWDDQVLRESLELRTIRGVAAAAATLRAGFTTIRDLGTEGAGYADVGLRDAIRAGIIAGPRVLTTTRAIVAADCYGPAGFDPRWELPQGAEEINGADAMRRAVRSQIAAGADWIKVYADFRRQPGAEATPTLSAEELAAAVAEAASAGIPVVAHATSDAGVRRALDAGIRSIEHGDGASDETLRAMAALGAVLCPTLAASEAVARYAGWDPQDPGQPAPPRLRAARELVGRALTAGVTLGCGSDAGVFAHGDNAREIELLHACGMPPDQALRAATLVAARVLGREGALGVIAPGARADLVALAADPLADPRALRRPALVMQDGRIAHDGRGQAREAEVIAWCERFLDDWSKRRFDAAQTAFTPGATVAISVPSRNLTRLTTARKFIEQARPALEAAPEFREWISGPVTARVDGDIAMVWAPFRTSSASGETHGVDAFQLVRSEGRWRIASLAFTSR
ncbi:MAG: amidohydrolase family protein [Planctomycetota bacterium]|nr:MAG: amidohydrolase family protein [Planctomycetota bacterium]